MFKRIKIILLGLALIAGAILVLPAVSQAQQSQEGSLFLTWKALNFYPSNYPGKAYPTNQSSVLISATAVQNSQITSLDGANFLWYIDGTLYRSGEGLKEIEIDMSNWDRSSRFIRLVVETENGSIEQSTTIPTNKSEIVIEPLDGDKTVQRGGSVQLKSTPYFFDASSFDNLSFFWQVDGQNRNESSNQFSLDVNRNRYSSGDNILITSIVSNQENRLDSSKSNLILQVE